MTTTCIIIGSAATMLFPFIISLNVLLSVQIHKQAPPLEDISEDCSPAMRGLLERALERVPSRRSSATDLLNEEALHPSREDQPRCWSLDSALGDSTHPLIRQHSQMTDSTQGKHTDIAHWHILSVELFAFLHLYASYFRLLNL